MKTLARYSLLGMWLTSGWAWAQGTILFQNYGPGLYAPVTDRSGNPLPPGTTYTIELWAGWNASSLVPVAQTYLTSPGIFGEGQPELALWLPPGYHPVFSLRLWNNQGGTISTWQEAFGSNTGEIGESGQFRLPFSGPGLGDPNGMPPTVAPPLYGMPSFTFYILPEPSSVAFLALGALLLLLPHCIAMRTGHAQSTPDATPGLPRLRSGDSPEPAPARDESCPL